MVSGAQAASPTAPTSGDRRVFRCADITVGEFVCPPHSELWGRENQIAEWHVVVFPHNAVEIQQAGRAPVVADPNHVMLYNARQPYRRTLLDRRGDEAVFFAIPVELIIDMLRDFDPKAAERRDAPFPVDHGPVAPRQYLDHARVFQMLAARRSAGRERDSLRLDEGVVELVAATLGSVFKSRGLRSRQRPVAPRTRARHRDQVHHLRRTLALRFRTPMSLADLAVEAGLSSHHAARLFRRHVGMTMHAYRAGLRLRSSLRHLAEGHPDGLAGIALELGYSSHSHFSTSFREAFGLPPSAVWRDLSSAQLHAFTQGLDRRRAPASSESR